MIPSLMLPVLALAAGFGTAIAAEPLKAAPSPLSVAAAALPSPLSKISAPQIADYHTLSREAEALFGGAHPAIASGAEPSPPACARGASNLRCRSSD